MKKAKLYIVLVLLIILLIGCNKGEALGIDTLIDTSINIDQDNINQYKIEVELDEENKSYRGKQWTTYVNNTTIPLEEVYFHIYPNAFKSLETAPIIFDQIYENPLSYIGGSIDIINISASNENLEYLVMGEDETLLYIKLDEPILPNDKVDLYLEYSVDLPSSKDRFGYGDRVINGGNWYPIACVYDIDGWNLEPYYKIGDPFYSDISNYKVEMITSKDTIIASSGNVLTEEIKDDKKIYQIEGKLIRDFAWVASKEFKIKEVMVENTMVKLYYLDTKSFMINQSLDVAAKAISIFNRVFGAYPYGQYSIVMTEFPSGMEFPGLVFINNDYYLYSRRDILEQVIVHETAHQWWYGVVGSNQVKEAWLDEGLTTYSESIYYSEAYGDKIGVAYFNKNIREGYEYGRKYYLGSDQNINKHLKEFSGWNEYGILVYLKGAMFINQIKEDYGEEVLYEIYEKYYSNNKFNNATTEDFIKLCEEVTGDSFDRIINEWLY